LSLFSDLNISQGSVTTPLRCGQVFNDNFIANLLANLSEQEVWKSVSIWWRYKCKCSVLLFGSQSTSSSQINVTTL